MLKFIFEKVYKNDTKNDTNPEFDVKSSLKMLKLTFRNVKNAEIHTLSWKC